MGVPMGQGKFSIDPDSLRHASQSMHRCAEELVRGVGMLSAQVTGAGSPWGEDDIGSIFGMAYTEATQLGFQALNQLGAQLGEMADALKQVGDAIQGADEGESATFEQAATGTP